MNDKQETKFLLDLLIEDMTRMVEYSPTERKPRAKYPEMWKRLADESSLSTNVDVPSNYQNVWIWSDLHFGHKNIIDFSDRPFENVDQMDQHLVDNFNDYVKEDDISIWVGDVSFRNANRTNEMLDQCNGYKILVVGNHDIERKKKKIREMNFDEVHLLYHIEFPDISLVLTHYPMFNLPKNYPYINVHGHLHIYHNIDSIEHINVCCEYHGFKPVNLEEIYRWARMRKESMEFD